MTSVPGLTTAAHSQSANNNHTQTASSTGAGAITIDPYGQKLKQAGIVPQQQMCTVQNQQQPFQPQHQPQHHLLQHHPIHCRYNFSNNHNYKHHIIAQDLSQQLFPSLPAMFPQIPGTAGMHQSFADSAMAANFSGSSTDSTYPSGKRHISPGFIELQPWTQPTQVPIQYQPQPQHSGNASFPTMLSNTQVHEFSTAAMRSAPPIDRRMQPHPHPHLFQATLYISFVPPELVEASIAEALRECMPVRIKLTPALPSGDRLFPGTHHDWMSQHGTLDFDSIINAEKALATLPQHPYLVNKPVILSPYPPPQGLPLPFSPVPPRLLRPTRLIHAPSMVQGLHSVHEEFMVVCPTPGEVWHNVRPWGSIRQISVWVEESHSTERQDQPQSPLHWRAKVDFWYEDEAKRFEVGFGQTGSLIKGWQIGILKDPSYSATDLQYPYPPPMLHPQLIQLPPTPNSADITYIPEPLHPTTGELQNYVGVNFVPSPGEFAPVSTQPISTMMTAMPTVGIVSPLTPSLPNYSVAWAGHNLFSAAGAPLSPPLNDSPRSTSFRPADFGPHQVALRNRSSNISMRSSSSSRKRMWSANWVEVPGEGPKSVGIVADDGTVIQHGPGQHIQPAPLIGPGSTSASGLVDYSNVFVKGLDSDITSYYLSQIFEKHGRIVSARVMRDEVGRSRGYGFVSFETPEEASQAIKLMNGTKSGMQSLSVTLHEPRKLRPEKIAERQASGLPVSYGRGNRSIGSRGTSPPRTDRRGRHENQGPGVTDEVRLLSPVSRKVALSKRVTFRVKNYARQRGIADSCVERAVKSLVDQDLELVPLLHDSEKLEAKIAEALSNLLEDPERKINQGIRHPGSPSPELGSLVAKDPDNMDADPVIDIMPATENESQYFESQRYNVCKNAIIRPQGTETSPQDPNIMVQPLVLAESPSSDVADQPQDVTIASLASMSSKEAIALLTGPNSDAIRKRLGLSLPSEQVVLRAKNWSQDVLVKSTVERKVDIASQLVKVVEAIPMTKSCKVKMARYIVNSEEDDQSLCELLLYPAVIGVKVQALVDLNKLN